MKSYRSVRELAVPDGKWIVAVWLDYYPSVYEFDTEEEARAKYEELKASNVELDMMDECKVYLAFVIESCGNRLDE